MQGEFDAVFACVGVGCAEGDGHAFVKCATVLVYEIAETDASWGCVGEWFAFGGTEYAVGYGDAAGSADADDGYGTTGWGG